MVKQQRPRRAPRRAPRKSVRGRKSYGRRRQSVRQQSKGLPKRQTLQSNLGGLSLTRFVAARRPTGVARHIKMSGAPNFINITYPGIITGSGGTQEYSSWYLNCANDLQRIWASIQALQVANGNVGSGTITHPVDSSGNSPNATFRFVLETATSMLHLANTSGTPQNLELYDIVAKRDSPQAAQFFNGTRVPLNYSSGLGYLDPSVAWEVGMGNAAADVTGFKSAVGYYSENVDAVNLGATPYNSKLFKDFFKVVRKTNVSLPIGGQHKHYVDLKPNAIIDNDFMSQNAVYKGLSYFTLVVASGVPVVKCPVDGGNPLGDTTTSAVSVSVIQQVKYKWTWVQDTRENIYRANFINTMNSNGAQSIQPAYTKVAFADSATAQVDTSNTTLSLLPSECTRLDASGAIVTDCGC